jgi:hypothetical protein
LNPATTLRVQYSYVLPVHFESHSADYSAKNLHLVAARLILAY